MKTLDEMIAVMVAARDGKQIQVWHQRDNAWLDTTPSWSWSEFDYRVKPEPRRWFIRVRLDGSAYVTSWPDRYTGEEVVEVVEVLK